MNEIDLSEITAVKSGDRLREIAEGIAPGKGILMSEVADEIGITTSSLRNHARKLGCYQVLTIKGTPTAIITSLKP